MTGEPHQDLIVSVNTGTYRDREWIANAAYDNFSVQSCRLLCTAHVLLHADNDGEEKLTISGLPKECIELILEYVAGFLPCVTVRRVLELASVSPCNPTLLTKEEFVELVNDGSFFHVTKNLLFD